MLKRLLTVTGLLLGISIAFHTVNTSASDTVTDLYGEEVSVEDTDSLGDEMDVITNTIKSEENSCQVNIKGSIPDKFALDLFVDFKNEETGRVYRLYALSKNEYRAFLFVPAGDYSILECSVYGDNTGRYPLIIPDDFSLLDNEIYTLETSLIEEKEVTEEIKERVEEKIEPESKPAEKADNESDNILKVKEIEHKDPYPWRKIRKSSGLEADVTVTGTSNDEYDIVIKFVKTGTIEEAEFIYSTDGGKSFSNNQLLTSNVILEDTGLIFHFPKNDTTGQSKSWVAVYKEGETVKFTSHPELPIKAKTSKNAVMNAYTVGHSRKDIDVVIRIVKSGDINTALFDYSLDGGKSFLGQKIPTKEDYSMEKGDVPVILQFSDISGIYVVNDEFSLVVSKEAETINTKFVLCILFAVFGSIIFIAYLWLLSQKEAESAYTLNSYTPWKKRNKKNRKNKA